MTSSAGPVPTDPGDLSATEIAARLELLLARSVEVDRDLQLSRPTRVFGGNARLAWSSVASWTDDEGPHDQPLILLVRGAGSQVTTQPVWEVAVLECVTPQGVRAPRVWAHDLDGQLFGGPAVLLQQMPGSADPVAFLSASNDTGRARTLDLARAIAGLHRADPAGLPTSEPLVALWEDRFRSSRLEPLPTLSWLFGWLSDHERPAERLSVVHGDLRPGNVLYEENRITALLDWEMAHVGDPVEDVAWAYRALWSPERFVPLEEFVTEYECEAGAQIDLERLRWQRVFCEVKFATIGLQAARAVVDGRSHNLRLIDRARTVRPALARSLRWITGKEQPC